MNKQIVFCPAFKSGTRFNGWDYLEPGDPYYNDQFVEAFVSGNYALCRYGFATELWWAIELGGHVTTSFGQIRRCITEFGLTSFEGASKKFEELTGIVVPEPK